MGTKPRLCVNCKHFDKDAMLGCRRVVETHTRCSRVTGKVEKFTTCGRRAANERRWGGPHHCGKDAKFYEEKRLLHRIFAKCIY